MKLMTLKSSEIKDIISRHLSDKIISDGFSFKKISNEFRCQNEDFTYIFNIEQVAWSNSFSLHVKLWISQKKVESILETIVGKTRHKITMGNEIDKIFKSPDGRTNGNRNLSIWMYQNQDVDAAVESLEWYYNDIACPYFQKYKTLKAMDDVINNSPFDHCPVDVGGSFDNRCMKGLIIAMLIGNPNYEKLGVIYDEVIKETMNSESIENYYKVRNYLMYNRISK